MRRSIRVWLIRVWLVGLVCVANPATSVAALFPCTAQGILDAIAAGGGPHTFDCAGPTIVTAPGLTIDNDVILDGEGELILRGFSTPSVTVASGITTELIGIGFFDGSAPLGGGISNGGNLTLTRCEIWGNEATAEGGGILNSGVAVLIDTTVSGNTAPDCGGISSTGDLTLVGTTVSGNEATAAGAGIGIGGGICSPVGSLSLTNSTLSGNHALQGGGLFGSGSPTVVATTIAANTAATAGSAISNAGLAGLFVQAENLIIEGDCDFGTGFVVSNGGNIESPGDTCGLATVPDPTDQRNVSAADLSLRPLADNGGPTLTHAVLTDSVALEAGAGCPPPATDQRGLARPADGDRDGTAVCDVGAFELQPCFTDLTGDGAVGVPDFAVLIGTYGTSVPPGSQGDYTGDGMVGAPDFAFFGPNFGCTP